jgi:hypothetical protein
MDYIIYYFNKCTTSADVELQSDDSNRELFASHSYRKAYSWKPILGFQALGNPKTNNCNSSRILISETDRRFPNSNKP